MSFSASPSVEFTETNLSFTVANLPSSITGCVIRGGDKVPRLYPVSITSEADLIDKFGTPNSTNYIDWFNAYNFLQYANSLIAVSPMDSALATKNVGIALQGGNWDGSGDETTDFTKMAVRQGVEFGDLYNPDVASLTLDSMSVATISNKVLAVATASGGVVSWFSRGVLRGFQLTAGGAGILTANGVNVISASATGATVDAASWHANVDFYNDGFGAISIANDTPAAGKYTLRATITNTGIVVLNRGITYKSGIHQNIAIAIASNANTWGGRLDKTTSSTFSSIWQASNAYSINGGIDTNNGPEFSKHQFAYMLFNVFTDGTVDYSTVLEKGVCNYLSSTSSQISNADDAKLNGESIFCEDIINKKSKYIYIKVSSSFSTSTSKVNTCSKEEDLPVLHHSDYSTVYPRSSADYVMPATYSESSVTQGDVETAFDLFEDPGTITVNMLMGHKLAPNYASTLAAARKDCVAIISPFDETELVGKTSSDGVTYLLANFGNKGAGTVFNTWNTYSAVYGNMKYQLDKWNNKNRWLSPIGDVCGLIAQTDKELDPWWAAAGLQRGVMRNTIKLAFNPNKAGRDSLYLAGINPIVTIAGEGAGLIMGQKTSVSTTSALDRINVRRLMITIEQAIVKSMRPFMFEFNDSATRNQILSIIRPYMETVKNRRGVYDYLVVCDESNNTAEVIDGNGLVIGVFVKPTRVAEFIQISFVVTRTDANFSELA